MLTQIDATTLQMALAGFQSQLAEINAKVREIQRILDSGPGRGSRLSAAGHKRIVEAQRKRRAAFHNSAASQKGAAKRTMPPEAQAKFAPNHVKTRAAKAASA